MAEQLRVEYDGVIPSVQQQDEEAEASVPTSDGCCVDAKWVLLYPIILDSTL